MEHLLFRKKNTAMGDRNEEWERECEKDLNENYYGCILSAPDCKKRKRKEEKGEGNYERRVVLHAHSYLIYHSSCCCINPCHSSE